MFLIRKMKWGQRFAYAVSVQIKGKRDLLQNTAGIEDTTVMKNKKGINKQEITIYSRTRKDTQINFWMRYCI